jgi:fumarylacetoacetase
MTLINETHDASLRSWVPSSNRHNGDNGDKVDFPIQNLPFCVFRRRGGNEDWRGGVAIGDEIVDLGAVAKANAFEGLARSALQAASEPTLNRLMGMGPTAWSALRLALSRALREGAAQTQAWQGFLVPQAAAEFRVPAQVGDYTDFYTSIHHATTVGRLFRPDNPLLPNYKWVPIGYHGRASSLGVSGQAFRRPRGQVFLNGTDRPVLEPSRRMDYELEMGIFIGVGNEAGSPIPIEEADQHVFGFCLLNDWSARDIQSWEYQPLGPFLSKNFATTLSPWIVTAEALAPYRGPWHRDPADPQPLSYLDCAANRETGALDVCLEVRLETERMRSNGDRSSLLTRTSFRHAYWTVAQMIAHHSVNGCNLQPGDLLGTGTLSGPGEAEAGSLLELTRGGKHEITLTNGEARTFLEDGDTVIFRGWCERDGAARIGFGEARGTMLAS